MLCHSSQPSSPGPETTPERMQQKRLTLVKKRNVYRLGEVGEVGEKLGEAGLYTGELGEMLEGEMLDGDGPVELCGLH